MSAVKYLWPTNHLLALVTQPGGKTRTAAITGAAECLEEDRDSAIEGMRDSLAAIEAVLAKADGRDLERGDVYQILQHTDRLANVATAFEMPLVMRVMSSMGELGMALLEAASRPYTPFAVHLRAARWAVDNTHVSEAEAEPVIAGLLKVVGRFDERTRA